MKKKELKNLAKQLAKQELIIAANESSEAVIAAQTEIMRLSKSIHDFQDLDLIDEMVQELLKEKNLDN